MYCRLATVALSQKHNHGQNLKNKVTTEYRQYF